MDVLFSLCSRKSVPNSSAAAVGVASQVSMFSQNCES